MNTPLPQIRINAAISYCFLAPLFLLARNNPIYAEQFVQEHSRRAFALQAGLLGYYLLRVLILGDLLSYTLPIFELRVDRLVTLGVTMMIFGLLVYGALQAFRGHAARESLLDQRTAADEDLSGTQHLSEAEIMRTLGAFIPFVSFFIAERFNTPLTRVGSRVTGFFTLCLIASLALSRGDALFYSLLFLLVFSFVSVAIHLVFKIEPTYLNIARYLPSLSKVMSIVRATPGYILDLTRVLIGKLDHLSFLDHYTASRARDALFESQLAEHFTQSKLVFSPYIIYIPGLNLLLFSLFFAPGKSTYALAVGQGMMLTLLCIAAGLMYGWDTPYLLFALIPMAMGLATIKSRPFARIPVLYELSVLLSYLSFGLMRGSRIVRSKSAQVRTVSLRVE